MLHVALKHLSFGTRPESTILSARPRGNPQGDVRQEGSTGGVPQCMLYCRARRESSGRMPASEYPGRYHGLEAGTLLMIPSFSNGVEMTPSGGWLKGASRRPPLYSRTVTLLPICGSDSCGRNRRRAKLVNQLPGAGSRHNRVPDEDYRLRTHLPPFLTANERSVNVDPEFRFDEG